MKKNPRHSKGESQVKIKKKRENDITQNLSYVAIMFDRLFIKILRYSVLIIYIIMKRVYMLTCSGYFWVVGCRELCISELILSLLRISFTVTLCDFSNQRGKTGF